MNAQFVGAPLYGAGTIKRNRRTRARINQLDNQIVDVLREDHPQSVRHVFYRMTNPRLAEPVEKSERGYRHVQRRLEVLRRDSRVPYGWISDATRRGYFTPTYKDAADFVRQVKGFYRADLWQYSNFYCEVWTESRSIAGIIERDCRELAVPLYPSGGFSGITLAYEAAEHINEEYEEVEVVILYIGDYDPAGVLIDKSIERELRQHLNPGISLDFRRIGITQQQIAAFDLPTKPRKGTDKRALHITETVEAEAMPAAIMRSILRTEIEALLPAHAVVVAQAAEESELEHIDRIIALLAGSPS